MLGTSTNAEKRVRGSMNTLHSVLTVRYLLELQDQTDFLGERR